MAFKLVALFALTLGAAFANEEFAMSLKGERELQQFEACALPHTPGSVRNFIIVNVNAKSDGKLRWLPRGDAIVTFSNNRNTMSLDWEVYPQDSPEGPYMTVKATFSAKTDYEDCWCAQPPFTNDPENPNYGKVQNSCTQKNWVQNREGEELDYLFCPKCEGNVCSEANSKRDSIGTPKPIWLNWDFYTAVDGQLGGPGLALFRETVYDLFPETNPDTTTCTMDLTNVPLPQFGCSDMENPPDGYGYGANAKNLECGFATWFNCKEDLEALGGDETIVHVADINFNFGPCPTPEPTPVPSEICIVTPDECAEYQNPDGDNFCSTEENCGGDFIFDTNNRGRGCSRGSTGNDGSCGCCRRPTPEPTPEPTPAPSELCPVTPEDCSAVAGVCAIEEQCGIGNDFITSDRGLGCNRGSTGNDGDCGCCVPQANFRCPTTPPSCGSLSPNEIDLCAEEEFCEELGGVFDTSNDGQGCGRDGNNQQDCGCCRILITPEPTPAPSEICVVTPDECAEYQNADGDNFCSTEENCGGDFIFDTNNRGRGCSRGSTGNDGSCGCCRRPTPAPTPEPTPFPSEQCVVTPPSCAEYQNDAGENYCSTEDNCPGDFIFDTSDRGRGCSRSSTGNDGSCGCCRPPTPEPTPQPTESPNERCVVTPPSCAEFDNEDGDNFCAVEDSCPDGYVFDSQDRGRGCNRGSTGNDGDCGCCRKPVLCVDEPCCKKVVNIIKDCNDVDGKLCPWEEL